MAQQNILFLYLNTGNGHITPAKILKENLLKRYGDSDLNIYLCHGFSKKQRFARFFFEYGYRFSSAAASGSYSLFYDINTIPFILQLTRHLVAWNTTSHIEKLILENNITKVVCFHFAIAGAVNRAIRRIQNRHKEFGKIPFVIVVTDPFSAHPSWFLEKNANFVVFSSALKEQMKSRYKIISTDKEKRVSVFPFILNPVLSPRLASQKHIENISENTELSKIYECRKNNEFVVLIAGGGEGLPNVFKLMKYIAGQSTFETSKKLTFVVVCGRNTVDLLKIKALKIIYPQLSIFPFGYVKFMPDLIKGSDVVVTKAGASMIMETLACKKPIIISTYIHGQELGNVRYVVSNKCGWFIQKPKNIYSKILQLRDNCDYYGQTLNNLKLLNVHPDVQQLSDYIFSL